MKNQLNESLKTGKVVVTSMASNRAKQTVRSKTTKHAHHRTVPPKDLELHTFQHAPSQMISPNLSTKEYMQTFLKAPTSLANLAQLSGISLVPVCKNDLPTLESEINVQGRQMRPDIDPNRGGPVHSLTSTNDHKSAKYQTRSQPVQSVPVIDVHSTKLRHDKLGCSKSKSTTAKKKEQHHKLNQNQGIQSKSDYLTTNMFSKYNVSLKPCSSINDYSKCQTKNESLSAYDNEMDLEHESSDVGMMRLMAVLNNPALTLTPVDDISSVTKSATDTYHPETANFINQTVVNLVQVHRGLGDANSISHSSNLPNSSKTCASKITRINDGIKLPKSAMNLIATGTGTATISAKQNTIDETQSYANSSSAGLDSDRTSMEWFSKVDLPEWAKSKEPDIQAFSYCKNQNDLDKLAPHIEPAYSTYKNIDSESAKLSNQSASKDDDYNLQMEDGSSVINSGSNEAGFNISSRVNLQQIDNGARSQEIVYNVGTDENLRQKTKKIQIMNSKDRLYRNCYEQTSQRKVHNLESIRVEVVGQKEVLVSDRHSMLEKMVEIAESVSRKRPTTEPDDILVDRSKMFMSKIDAILERRKRRRFERIRHESPEEDNASQSDLSEDDSVTGIRPYLDEATIIPIQLPLEGKLTEEKRKYLANVGLISRSDKNKLSIKQCEKRLRTISALALQEDGLVCDDIIRFVDTIVKTGGTEIQLRTETNIKRNELPFIEGLNRNTSRVKMNYMGGLGLDKRSKRTTLYKVIKPQEKNNLPGLNQEQQQDDLSRKTRMPINSLTKISTIPNKNIVKPDILVGAAHALVEPALILKMMQLPKSNCREALQVPKDEYMRSLGLMAS